MSGYFKLTQMGDQDVIRVEDFKGKAFRSVPNTVVYDITKGRARKAPFNYIDNEDLKVSYNKQIVDLSPEQLRTYNRLAQRKSYAKKQAIELSGETAEQYKNKLNKKIKDMTKTEKAKYNRLKKREQRLRK
tara:strand:+ start:4603 stop:4995 length:393 start_codon:yes stop_codon:yes gene_type:complete